MDAPDADLVARLMPSLRKLRAYSRLEVEGADRIPPGPCILVANHTGWAGLDYANLFTTVHEATGRIPRVAVHPAVFQVDRLRDLARRAGFFEVSVATSTRILDEKGIVTFFPEAEEGNFKPIWQRYRLQEFKPGFARVALATEAPVVPVVIVGGEDANPTLGMVRIKHDLAEVPVPLPLSILPLPAKWRIAFLDPIDPGEYLAGDSPDKDLAVEMSRDLRARMQKELDRQVKLRGNPFF